MQEAFSEVLEHFDCLLIVVKGLYSELKNFENYANEENESIELTPPLGNGEQLARHWSAAAFQKIRAGA